MAKNYQWRTYTNIISGGYPGESVGVIGGASDWQTTSATTGNAHESYFFRDSDYMANENSSRVVVELNESWTASIDNRNYLTITLSTVIESIRRDDVVGNPGVKTRNMFARRDENGNIVWQTFNDDITTAHSIVSSPITLNSYTFTLAPGQELYRPSIYFRANVSGHDGDAVPSIYVDLMGLGVSFKNILPKETIPGKIYDGEQYWLSHNRPVNGHLKLFNGSSWGDDMKNTDGGVGVDDPPLIRWDNGFKNMRTIGKDSGL